MMNIEALIETDLPTVYAYTSTEIVKRKILDGQHVLKVIDEQDQFMGIVTAKDIFRHPYHLIADCIQDKPALRPEHSIYEATQILIQRQEDVAPVFSELNEFIGTIFKDNLTEYLLRYCVHLENQVRQQQI